MNQQSPNPSRITARGAIGDPSDTAAVVRNHAAAIAAEVLRARQQADKLMVGTPAYFEALTLIAEGVDALRTLADAIVRGTVLPDRDLPEPIVPGDLVAGELVGADAVCDSGLS